VVYRNDDGGAPAEPAVLMLKILMLQKWFNLSDPQAAGTKLQRPQ